MSKWEENRLGKVAPFKYGKAMTADKRIFGDFNVFSSAGICGKSKMYLAKHGIVIGRKGSVGTVYYSESPFFCIDTAFYIDEIDPQYSMKFLYYYMKLLHLENYNNDAAVPGLNRNLAEKLKISCPDLPTQERIADILSAYDDLIEANNRRIELLEQAAQELYKEWFVRFRFPGHEKAKFENGLPEGWRIGKFKDELNYNTGKLDSNASSEDGKYSFYTCAKTVYKTNTYCFDGECVLLGGNNATGDFSLFYANEKLDAYQRTYIVTPQNPLLSCVYIYFVLKNYLLQFKTSSIGATTKFLTKGMLDKAKIIIPDTNILLWYNELSQNMFKQITLLKARNENLAAQRDLLLPRLMSGKLEV